MRSPSSTEGPKKKPRPVVTFDKAQEEEDRESISSKASDRLSVAELMAMCRAGRSTEHPFVKMKPQQQAQSLVEAFGEAIDDIAKGAATNPFPEKIQDAFTKALTPFVTQCISILKDKAANPKRAPLQYMAALKEGILKDGKLPLIADRREADHSLLARPCYGLIDNGYNLEDHPNLKYIWEHPAS